jgi:hypothetical protein
MAVGIHRCCAGVGGNGNGGLVTVLLHGDALWWHCLCLLHETGFRSFPVCAAFATFMHPAIMARWGVPGMQVSAHAPGEASSSGRPDLSRLEEGLEIRGLLRRNTEELDGVMRALNGEYIEPEAGGDLLRDGAGVLPTGAARLPTS